MTIYVHTSMEEVKRALGRLDRRLTSGGPGGNPDGGVSESSGGQA